MGLEREREGAFALSFLEKFVGFGEWRGGGGGLYYKFSVVIIG